MRPRSKPPRKRLPPRELAICRRLAEARQWLGIDQATAARKIGIPKSTLSNYELGVVALKAALALRICRNLIISEEWLATGRFALAEAAGKVPAGGTDAALAKIHVRMCMDLGSAPEAAQVRYGALFSEAYEAVLARVYAERVKVHYHGLGIPATAWQDSNPELGKDILVALVERHLLLLSNEAAGRKASKEHAVAVYLGFLMRMAIFDYLKCVGRPVDVTDFKWPVGLFSNPAVPILAFEPADRRRREAAPPPVVVGTP